MKADETHFVVNMDDGKSLVLLGDSEVKYSDVSSCGVGRKMFVMISGRHYSASCPPFMIFKNEHRNYPIRVVPDAAWSFVYNWSKVLDGKSSHGAVVR